ncbi:sensor histidine kinase [Nocardioides aurantiacus]|uniref:Sensor-like histidine kinase SenX3 n=1 Tax=Nocardioides aurantiacus TaxID=86796 RepID=A0A3N2CXL8_9ACTN|nr:HAMP domain-containing sensor histidine kinase [Nocardioides aurantiacus]ROR92275.1 phospho-acceptor domain-containing protein [Nocardioides aurantiacus]
MDSSGAAPAAVDDVLRVLAGPDDVDLQDLLRLAAVLCDAEAAGMTIRRQDCFHVPLTFGIEPFVCPADDTFCATVMDRDEVVVVPDAQERAEFRTISWVDGTRASTRFYASAPLHSPDGGSLGRLCVIDPRPHDLGPLQRRSLGTLAASVTQLIELRLRRETDLGTSRPEGEAATTVVSQIAAELSHDMRVPLAALTAGVELLEDQLADHRTPTVDTLLERMRSSAGRLLRMLEQNLDLDPAETRRTSTDVDLGRVVERLVADSAHVLDPVGAVVETRNLPVVRADPDAMYAVLQNLLGNAVKFARPDVAPWIRVTARRRPGGYRIAVRDNGVGIPDERRAQAFALFQRGDHDVEGHGIGLATVSRLVRAHRGDVGIDAVPEGGTEVWFELPDEP